jgi:hypothetical protein
MRECVNSRIRARLFFPHFSFISLSTIPEFTHSRTSHQPYMLYMPLLYTCHPLYLPLRHSRIPELPLLRGIPLLAPAPLASNERSDFAPRCSSSALVCSAHFSSFLFLHLSFISPCPPYLRVKTLRLSSLDVRTTGSKDERLNFSTLKFSSAPLPVRRLVHRSRIREGGNFSEGGRLCGKTLLLTTHYSPFTTHNSQLSQL